MANELNVKIVADISSLKAALEAAQAQVRTASANMSEAQTAFGAAAQLGNEQARAALAAYTADLKTAEEQLDSLQAAQARSGVSHTRPQAETPSQASSWRDEAAAQAQRAQLTTQALAAETAAVTDLTVATDAAGASQAVFATATEAEATASSSVAESAAAAAAATNEKTAANARYAASAEETVAASSAVAVADEELAEGNAVVGASTDKAALQNAAYAASFERSTTAMAAYNVAAKGDVETTTLLGKAFDAAMLSGAGFVEAQEAAVAAVNAFAEASERAAVTAGADAAAMNGVATASARTVSGSMAAQGALRTLEGSMFGASRAAGTLLTSTLGLGPVFEAAFSVIGAVALISILYQVGEELVSTYEKATQAGAAISAAFGDASDKLQQTTDQIILQNSKLQDEIDKLSGHPNNGLQTALDEDIVAADKLQDALDGVVKKIDTIYKNKSLQVGLGASLLTGRARTGDVTDAAGGIVDDAGQATQQAKDRYDAQLAGAGGDRAKVIAATKTYHEAIQKIIDDANAKLQPSLDDNVRMQKAAEEALGEDPAKASIFKRFGVALGEAQTGQAVNVADYSARINDLKQAQDLLNKLKAQMDAMEAQAPLEQKKGQLEQQRAQAPATIPEAKVGPSRIAEEIKRETDASRREVADYQRVLDDLGEIDRRFAKEQDEAATAAQKAANREEISAAQQTHDQNAGAIQTQETKVEDSRTLGNVNPTQALEEMRALHAQEIAEDERFIQQEMAIYAKEPQELDRLQKELDQVHQRGLQEQLRDTTKILQEEQQKWKQFGNELVGDFNQTVNKLITTQEKPAQAFARMLDQMLSQGALFVEKWIEQQVEMWAKQEIEQALGITTQKSIQATANAATIASDAAVAGAGAYAATAAIPIVGPALAPAAAASAYAATISFIGLAAFEAGGIVSGAHGMPVPIMAHAGERVLSAPQTQNFERMVNQPQGGAGQFHMHYNGQVNAFDRNGMRQTLQSHAEDIGEIVKDLWNAGKLK